MAEALRPGLRPVPPDAGGSPSRPWDVDEQPEEGAEETTSGHFGLSRVWRRPGLGLSLFFSTVFGFAYYIDVTADGKLLMLVGALLSATAIATAFLSPRIFPLLAIAYLPFCKFYPIDWNVPPGNMTNMIILAGGLAWGSARLRGKAVFPFDRFDLGLLAFICVAFGACLRTHQLASESTIGGLIFIFKWWLSPLVFYYFARGVLEDREDVWDTVIALCWVGAVVGALTWREGVNLGDRGSIEASRVLGLMRQSNNMGAFLVYYGLPMFAFFLTTKSMRNRVLYLGGFLLTVRAVLFTFSRGAYLALLGGAGSILAFSHPIYVVAGGTVAGIAYMNPQLIPESIAARMGSTVTSDATMYDDEVQLDKSNAMRIVLWKAALAMIEENPVRGVGISQFPRVVDLYTEIPLPDESARDAHNAYLLTAAEMGLPGIFFMMVCLLWLLGTALWLRVNGTHDLDRRLAMAFAGVMGGVLVSCMFGSRFSDECLIGCFWILAGTIRAVVMLERQEAEPLA